MAKQLQFNESFTEAEITGLTAIPERDTGDIYKASDTGVFYEVIEDSTVVIYRKKILVDQTFDATFTVGGSDIHDNGSLVEMTDKVLDAGWSRSGNVITYTGEPEKVTGIVSINAPDNGTSSYWARPKLRVIKDGDVIAVLDDLVMQQNGAYDGDFTLNGSFFDKEPSANPSYTFEWFRKDNRISTLPPEDYSQIAMTATNKVEVLV